MGKITFVVEFEDGKEPPVSANLDVAGGRLVSVLLVTTEMTSSNQKKLM